MPDSSTSVRPGFPLVSPPKTLPSRNPETIQAVHRLWDLQKQIQPRKSSRRLSFQEANAAWHRHQALQQARGDIRRSGRAARRQWSISQIEDACNRNDLRTVYQVVSTLLDPAHQSEATGGPNSLPRCPKEQESPEPALPVHVHLETQAPNEAGLPRAVLQQSMDFAQVDAELQHLLQVHETYRC